MLGKVSSKGDVWTWNKFSSQHPLVIWSFFWLSYSDEVIILLILVGEFPVNKFYFRLGN